MTTNNSKEPLQTTEKLQRLHDVTRQMMRADTKPVLFRTVTEAASELLGFEFNTVRRYDSEREQLLPTAVSPALRDQTGDRRVYERYNTVQWQAIDSGEILVFQEVADIEDSIERSGGGSMMVVPLTDFGVLTMGSSEPRAIDEDDIQLAEVFGANIETAIERVERLEVLNDREQRLSRQTQQIMVMNRVLRHNIRNELNLLIGWQTALRENVAEENIPHVQESLETIQEINSLAKQARTIQEALSADGDVREVDLVELTTSQIDRAREEFETAVLTTDLPESAPVMAVERIRGGVREAIENAIIHNEGPQPNVHVSIDKLPANADAQYQLTIEDNGPGIPREERQVLRDESEHKLKHGSGLGLWYLKWLVDRSGATLQFADSQFETGTAIQILFRD